MNRATPLLWLLGFLVLLCSLLADVGAGLHHLHIYAGIVHNDVKPENILLKPEAGGRLRAMVGDLGVASCERCGLSTSFGCTAIYCTPKHGTKKLYLPCITVITTISMKYVCTLCRRIHIPPY